MAPTLGSYETPEGRDENDRRLIDAMTSPTPDAKATVELELIGRAAELVRSNTHDYNATELLKLEAVKALLEYGLRHESRDPKDYLRKFLTVGRFFAYATHDGSWGEFEKEFEIIVQSLLRARSAIVELGRIVAALKSKGAP